EHRSHQRAERHHPDQGCAHRERDQQPVRTVIVEAESLPGDDAGDPDGAEDAAKGHAGGASRRAMRHQSPRRTSCRASARMMSEVAWDPELPPELMMSGMKSARTMARLSSASKCCMAVAVSISLMKSAQSQPARLRIIIPKPIFV